MRIRILAIGLIVLIAAGIMAASPLAFAKKGSGGSGGGPGGGGGGGETVGNCLSYPVIWAEGVTKALPGTPGQPPVLNGNWWYQWGTNGEDPNIVPASCPPDPDETNTDLNPGGLPLCDDGIAGSVDLNLEAGIPVATNSQDIVRAYLQKDPKNVWQAGSADWSASDVVVDWIDWGDNLESVNWYSTSQVRTEVVLFQDNPDPNNPWLEYEMRHTSGWGIDEVHGIAATLTVPPTEITGPGTQATVYSYCARLTIQKLLVPRDDLNPDDLIWIPEVGWTEKEGSQYDLIRPAIYNSAVYEGGDGPGFYSAEINVKGRIIYGYTWNVQRLNDVTGNPPSAAGDYRITFSLDEKCGNADRNTFFEDGVTEIKTPIEVIEDEAVTILAESDDSGGGVAVIDYVNGLTYIDIRILQKGGGSGGGGSGGGGHGGH